MSYSRIACGMPNSTTPVTGPIYRDWNGVGQTMAQGAAGLRDLVESLGGVWPGADGSLSGRYGQPAPGAGGGRENGRSPSSGLPDGRASSLLPAACGSVLLAPSPGSYRPPAPPLAQPIARVVSPRVARKIEQAPTLPLPQSKGATICDQITAANVCEAAVRGCFAAGQVEPLQLAACAASGWQGNRNEFPALIASGGAGGGQHVGLIAPYPRMPNGALGPGIVSVNDSAASSVREMAAGVGLGQYNPFEAAGNGAMILGLALLGGAFWLSRRGAR